MDDLINRQEVIDILAEMQGRCTSKTALIQNNKIWQQIKALPPAERKKGEWQTKIVKQFCAPDCWYPGIFAIEGSWNEKEGSWLEKQGGFCSECGKQDEHYNSHNYCPLCGIRMRGDENATG